MVVILAGRCVSTLGFLQSIAVAVHLKNVDVVRQSVDEGGCVGTDLGGLAVQALWCPVGVSSRLLAARHMPQLENFPLPRGPKTGSGPQARIVL